MSDEKDWKTFASFRQMAWWMLNTGAGERWLSWFTRKKFRELLSTETGNKFYEWVRAQVLAEIENRPKIVIERFPDGYLKVYAVAADVHFVHRLETSSDQAEILADQLAEIECPLRMKDIYPGWGGIEGKGRCIATDFYKGQTVEQEVKKRSRIEMLRSIDRKTTTAT